jgi:hypothetical protein
MAPIQQIILGADNMTKEQFTQDGEEMGVVG